MEEVAAVGGKEVKDRALRMPIPAGGCVAREFVQQEGSRRDRADAPSMDPDIILWKDPAREIPYVGPVDRDASLEYEILTGAARTQTRRGQKTIQAQTRIFGCAPDWASPAGGVSGRVIRRGDQASGLVLGRPMTR